MVEHEYILSSSLTGELLLFRTLWNNSSDNMFIVAIDSDGDFVTEACNTALEKTFHLEKHQMNGKKLKDIFDDVTFKMIFDNYTKCIALNKPITYNESAIIDHTGERFWNTTILPVIDEKSGRVRIFGISREFTQLKIAEKKLQKINETLDKQVKKRTKALEKANKQLKRLSTMDDLTELPNRRYFEEYFQTNWEVAKKQKTAISLVMCDIDYFKKINDTHGHLVGDRVLKEIAKTIQLSSSKRNFVARYGGEEFIIVLCDTYLEMAYQLCTMIQDNLKNIHHNFVQDVALAPITMSFGISRTIPKHEDDPEQLIRHADNALYEAKNSGRNCIITSLV